MNKLLNSIISIMLRLVPTKNDIWITGQVRAWEYDNSPPTFFDNSKYFYIYLHEHTNEKVFWVTSSKNELSYFQQLGLPVVNYNSFHGKMIVAKAKYSFHHYGDNTINKIIQYGKIQMNFWHGTPLKKIAYDVEPKEETRHDWIVKFLDRKGKHYLSSTSTFLSKNILCHAFDMSIESILPFGYPRTDILGLDKAQVLLFCKTYSKNLLQYISIAHEKTVYLYMPTFRDDDYEYFEKANIDYDALDKMLEKNHSIFFIKLHPLTKYHTNINKYKNIVSIDNDVDIYPFLVYTDYLITDYSSIFFDFLHLNREIFFIPYDLENYISKRELYFDYKEFVPGKIFNTFSEFINSIDYIDSIDYSSKRKELFELFNENYSYDACEKIYHYLKDKETSL